MFCNYNRFPGPKPHSNSSRLNNYNDNNAFGMLAS